MNGTSSPSAFTGDDVVLSEFDVKPQHCYRHRADGKPGREIQIVFKGALTVDASLEVECAGKKEIFPVRTDFRGVTSYTVLLPDGAGVVSDCEVKFTLWLGQQSVAKTVRIPKMRLWTVYLYSHSHVDIGYTNTQKNVEILHANNVREGIKLGKETRDHPAGSRSRWNPEVTWPLERLWVKGTADERAAILQSMRDGDLCVDASYANLNTSACCDEELFHLFAFSRRLQALTGVPVDTLQQMDIPGFSWGIVPVMSQLGVRYLMSWPNTDRAGHIHRDLDDHPFWWLGPDGESKVLFLQMNGYGNSGSGRKGGELGRPWFGQRDPDRVPLRIQTGSADVDFIDKCAERENADYPFDFIVLSWSLWDNSPIDADIPAAVKAWNEQYASPRIVLTGAHDIMEMIAKEHGDKLPVLSGDLTEYWTDGLGAAARETALLRNARERLIQAETLWTMLRPGKPANRADFDEAWRYVMLAAEHTWCAENPTELFFQNVIWRTKQSYFREAVERSLMLREEALAPATDKSDGAFSPAEGPSAGGIAVFNTQSWAYGGIVTLAQAESRLGDRVVDDQGEDVLSQRLSTGELAFLVGEIPPFATRHYRVIDGKCPLTGECTASGNILANGILHVELDAKTGNILHLTQTATGREFVDAKPDGGINAFRWVKGSDVPGQPDTDIAIFVIENGPLLAELRVTSSAPGCRSVSRSIRLFHGQPWVECANVVDKLPLKEKDGVHFGFAFDLPQAKTRVDIPWGVMEVEKDQMPQANRDWYVLQRWLDISNAEAGVTWCSLDAPLFEQGEITARFPSLDGMAGFGLQHPWSDKVVNRPAIYSWAMNNHWHTNFPLTQDGPVQFRYRLLPHTGGFDAVAANRFGMEQAQPLVALVTSKDPLSRSLLALDNPRVVATILRSEEDAGATLRLRSLSDRPEKVTVTRDGSPAHSLVALPPYGCVSITLR